VSPYILNWNSMLKRNQLFHSTNLEECVSKVVLTACSHASVLVSHRHKVLTGSIVSHLARRLFFISDPVT
jgi:hypothetical protein